MPQSLRIFTALYFLSLFISLVVDWSSLSATIDEFGEEPLFGSISHGTLFTVSLLAIYGLQIFLWALVTSLRSRIAMWLLVSLAGLVLVGIMLGYSEYSPLELMAYGGSALLNVIAILFLFRKDARDWFARRESIDPKVFE